MIKNKQTIKQLAFEIKTKLDLMANLSKEDRKTDILYKIGCAMCSIQDIQGIIMAD